jgi:hypothetical protein
MEAIILIVSLVVILVIAIKLASDLSPKKESTAKASIVANAQKALANYPGARSESTPVSGQDKQELDGYMLIASSISSAVSNLLAPFRLVATIIGESPKSFDEIQFFAGFLRYADSFTEELCVSLAKGIRQLSLVPEVKGTPTASLARRIRLESFDKPDSVLNQYAQVLNILGVEYSRSSISGSAIKGAVVGKILSGGGEGSNEYAVLGGLVGAVGEISNKAVIQTQAKLAAYVAIQRYLDLLGTMPESLLDTGSALIYGGKVDFNRQSAALASIQDSIARRVRICSEITGMLPQIKAPTTKPNIDFSGAEWRGFLMGMLLFAAGLIAFFIVMLRAENVRRDIDLSTLLIGLGALSTGAFGLIIVFRTMRKRERDMKQSSKPESLSTRIQRLVTSL